MPMITVRSVDDIRNFYVDRLGFSHVMGMVGKDGQLDFCTVVMGEARIMFMRAPGDALSPGGKQPVEIYLEVEDVDALHNRLKKNGVAISDPLTLQWWGDRTFKVLDPNGSPRTRPRCTRCSWGCGRVYAAGSHFSTWRWASMATSDGILYRWRQPGSGFCRTWRPVTSRRSTPPSRAGSPS